MYTLKAPRFTNPTNQSTKQKSQKQDKKLLTNKTQPTGVSPHFLALLLMLALGALFYIGIDKYGLFDVDEAIFAQASVEMLESENYIAPSYNGEPRYHKPPLIYWLQASAMNFLDTSAMTARLPSIILGFLMIFGFSLFLDGMTGNTRFAVIASAILGINLSFMVIAKAATADMALNFFVLMGTLTFIANIYALKRGILPIIVGGILLGLALLTKGPVALLVPAVVIGTVIIMRPGFFYNIRCVSPFLVLLIIALTLAPWCFLIISQEGMDFFREFIMVHNVERFFGGFGNSQSGSSWYYIYVLLVGFFPWVLFLPSAILWVLEDFFQRLRSDNLEEALPALGLVWLVAVAVFFSFSATKLPHYIVPALPGAALLIAGRLDALPKKPLNVINYLVIIPITILFSGIFFVLKWLPDILLGKTDSDIAVKISELLIKNGVELPLTDPQTIAILSQDVSFGAAPIMISGIVLIGILMGSSLMGNGYRQGIFFTAGATWIALMLVNITIVPKAYQYIQQPLANIGEEIAENYSYNNTSNVYFVAIHQPSVRFVSAVPFTALDSPEQVNNALDSGTAFFVLKEENLRATLDNLPNNLETKCQGGYCLVTVEY